MKYKFPKASIFQGKNFELLFLELVKGELSIHNRLHLLHYYYLKIGALENLVLYYTQY